MEFRACAAIKRASVTKIASGLPRASEIDHEVSQIMRRFLMPTRRMAKVMARKSSEEGAARNGRRTDVRGESAQMKVGLMELLSEVAKDPRNAGTGNKKITVIEDISKKILATTTTAAKMTKSRRNYLKNGERRD